jgi:recombination protein RecT
MGIKEMIVAPSMRDQFAMVLPKHLTVDRFVRMALTAMLRTPKITECSPASVVKCLLDIAAWGIEADGRRCHLIPFKTSFKKPDGSWGSSLECTLILDWKGLAELAQRSGMIAKLHADLVCENDEFSYNLGEIDCHRIDFRQPRGKPYAAYARAVTKDGAVYCAVMEAEEIFAVRNNSEGWKAFEKQLTKSSPWDPANPNIEGEMWKKTAFRRLAKWLPLSPEFRDAIESDDTPNTVDVVATYDAPARIAAPVAPFELIPEPEAAPERVTAPAENENPSLI